MKRYKNKLNSGLVYKKHEGIDHWVGYSYALWSADFQTWIYNDDVGTIIFEITPRFPGEFIYFDPSEPLSPEEIENSRLYDEWIKDYKPFITRIIPRETAQQWLDQANFILETIEENIKRMQKEGKF